MTHKKNTRYYVPYGSNLNAPELKHLRNISLGRPVARVIIPDRELAFTLHSSSRKGGVLDARPALGSCITALMYEVDESVQEVIRAKEGSKYREFEGWVYTTSGERFWAYSYEVRPEYRQPFVKPDDYYFNVVRWAYKEHDLDPTPLEAAARGESNGDRPLFTYGTLMAGDVRHPFLATFTQREGVPCETWGKLYTLGEYPILVEHMRSKTLVPGETYLLSNHTEAFTLLDRVEGAREHTERSPGYYRTPVVVATEARGREVLVWCYVWWGALPKGAKRIAGDRWVRKELVSSARTVH